MEETEGLVLKETILIVDDDPLNLTILSNLLKMKYKIKIANNGTTALRVAESDPAIDLILLDIVMPDLDGFEVCSRLKEHPKLKEVPVLFTSGLTDTHDIVKGFHVGAVDYITKPFQPEEVYARVKVHLALKVAKDEIQSLLSKTLVGSIKLLMDSLTMTQPQLVHQSQRIRKYAKQIISKLEINTQDAWSIELATMLSHIGCISIPNSILVDYQAGRKLRPEDLERYMKYPELGARLIENIPRLEKTAIMIKHQLMSPYAIDYPKDSVEFIGSLLLHMLIIFDHYVENGDSEDMACNKVIQNISGCPMTLLRALREVIEEEKNIKNQKTPIAALKPGMILGSDIKMNDGTLLLTKNTEMTTNLIDMIQRLTQQGVCSIKEVHTTQ